MAYDSEIIVIGAGLYGTAIGYELAKRKHNVLVLEEYSVGGAGATLYSRGIVRVYDPDDLLMSMSLDGIKRLNNWNEYLETNITPFTRCGVGYLVAPENLCKAQEKINKFHDEMHPIELLRLSDSLKIIPELSYISQLRKNQWLIYEKNGGFIDTRLAARLLSEGIKKNNGVVLEGVSVNKIKEMKNEILIFTSTGILRANKLVVATGAAITQLLPDLPVFTRTIPLTCFHKSEKNIKKCLIDEVSGSYFRPEQGFGYYGGGAPQSDLQNSVNLPEFDISLKRYNEKLSELLFGDSVGKPISNIMGFDGYTKTFQPIIESYTGNNNIWVAAGFSGRGAKFVLSVANTLADKIESGYDYKVVA